MHFLIYCYYNRYRCYWLTSYFSLNKGYSCFHWTSLLMILSTASILSPKGNLARQAGEQVLQVFTIRTHLSGGTSLPERAPEGRRVGIRLVLNKVLFPVSSRTVTQHLRAGMVMGQRSTQKHAYMSLPLKQNTFQNLISQTMQVVVSQGTHRQMHEHCRGMTAL